MSVFIHAIESKEDAAAIIRQLKAAQLAGVCRVGIFVKSTIGYQSDSHTIENAIDIVERSARFF